MTNNEVKSSRRRFGAAGWIGWLVAAIFCGTTLWLGSDARYVRRQLTGSEGQAAGLRIRLDQANQLVTLLTSPAAQHVVLTAGGPAQSPAGQVSWIPSRGALVFVASGLKPLPRGQTYELWLVPAGKAPLAAGLFRPDGKGNATVELPPLPANVQAKSFLVTVETAGGSPSPSKAGVMRGSAGASDR